MKTSCCAYICVLLCFLAAPANAQRATKSVYFFIEPDSFSTVGKWAGTDATTKISIPQEVEIDCFKASGTCIEATAEYYSGHAHVNVIYSTVLKWDKDGIVLSDPSGVCMARTLIVNFADKSISVTHNIKQLNEKTKEACGFFGAKESESYVFVVKGTPRWEKEALETLR